MDDDNEKTYSEENKQSQQNTYDRIIDNINRISDKYFYTIGLILFVLFLILITYTIITFTSIEDIFT
jgi:lipopolysaccharide/colanic/teichoic acid biosynthesis glycosyltransferase